LFEVCRAELEGKMLEGDKPKKSAKVMKVTTDEHPAIAAIKVNISQLNTKVNKLITNLQSMSANHPPLAWNMNSKRGRRRQYWNQGRHQQIFRIRTSTIAGSKLKHAIAEEGNIFIRITDRKPESDQQRHNKQEGLTTGN